MVNKIFILICLSLLAANSFAANITVQVDRDPVSINESFKITFEADDTVSANPDFSPLQQDFEILSRSQSSNMQIINGSISKQTSWILFVMAKKTGKLIIPSIQVGNDFSPAISITVNEQSSSTSSAAENREMFIEVEAAPESTYVQSQILYTIRFYRAVNINGASMSEPDFNGGEVVAQKLGDDSTFETQRGGRRYIVTERQYALFPQQSGNLTINPIQLDVQIPVASPGLFDPFGQNSATRRLKSNSVSLDIKPIPGNVPSNPWLPATQLSLTEDWSQDPPEFVVGEPITRTLTLKAEGLTAAQLPSLAMRDNNAFKAYPDQPRMNDKRGSQGVSGTRQEKIALIPTQAGDVTLPAIEIPWWSTATEKMEVARLPARTVHVKAAPNSSAVATAAAGPALTAAPAPIPMPDKTQPESIAKSGGEGGTWFVISIVLALGWLVTVIAWFFSNRYQNPMGERRKQATTTSMGSSLNAVKKACLENNHQLTKTELLNWGVTRWPDDPPANLGEIGNRLGANVEREIRELNLALYGPDQRSWQGSALWQAFSVAAKSKQQTTNGEENMLVPLYP